MSNGILGVSQLEMLTQSGTGTITIVPPATNTDRTLTLPDETGTLVTTASVPNPLTSGTAVATTSGTSIDFTGIPSWVKRITVMFNGVSTNGGSIIQVQIGDSGGVETTSYFSGAWTANSTNTNATTGFIIHGVNFGARVWDGSYTLVSQDATNTWVSTGMCNSLNDNAQSIGMGRKQLSATLDRIRLTTVNGTDTFDAGSINIMYE